MNRVLLVALLLAACKGKSKDKPADPDPVPPHPMPEVAPAPVPGDWATCKAALVASPKVPATRQVAALIEACKPCGDWQPLLDAMKPVEDGGPKQKDILDHMAGCKAWCDPNAKARFVNAFEENRGKLNRMPWRALGDMCKEAVSAAPDARFMSAPYFALDRIARDAATHADAAPALAAIDLVLPAVSVTGAGLALPATAVTKPASAPSHVTITADEVRIGALPHGKLDAKGVTVTGADYPGAAVVLADLHAALAKLPQPVLVFAPPKLPAARLAEVIAAAAQPLYLAVSADSPLAGWDMYGMSPIELTGAGPPRTPMMLVVVGPNGTPIREIATSTPPASVDLEVHDDATVEDVARVLGAFAYKDVGSARVFAKAEKPAKPAKAAKP